MSFTSRCITVEGESTSEERVRPHKWAERFAGSMASYGTDPRLRYSNLLEPMVYYGSKSLRICRTLEASNPAMLNDILDFAQHYRSRVHGLAPKLEITNVRLVGDDVLAKAS